MRDYSPEARTAIRTKGQVASLFQMGEPSNCPRGTPMHGGTKTKDQADKLPKAPRLGHHVASDPASSYRLLPHTQCQLRPCTCMILGVPYLSRSLYPNG